MRHTRNFSDLERVKLIERISHVLNYTGAYTELHKLLVDREEVILHTDMENLPEELEDFIFNWTVTKDDEASLEAENAKLREDKERLTALEIQLRDKIRELKINRRR